MKMLVLDFILVCMTGLLGERLVDRLLDSGDFYAPYRDGYNGGPGSAWG